MHAGMNCTIFICWDDMHACMGCKQQRYNCRLITLAENKLHVEDDVFCVLASYVAILAFKKMLGNNNAGPIYYMIPKMCTKLNCMSFNCLAYFCTAKLECT